MRIFVLAMSALAAVAAWAEEAPKPSAPSNDPPLLEFARSNPGCSGFTDMCQTCMRAAGDMIQCSFPGIACVKQPWTCTRQDAQKPQVQEPK